MEAISTRLLMTVGGWAVAIALAVTLFRSCNDLDRERVVNDRLVQVNSELVLRNIRLTRALDRYEAISDSLQATNNAINLQVADRLGSLREQFGL